MMKSLIWILAIWALFIFLLIYAINFNWLSSYTLNYQMASLLKRIFLSPIWILVFCSWQFSHYLWDLKNSIAFVFVILYVIAFVLSHCNTVLVTISKIRATFLTKDFIAMNPRLSINKRAVTKRQNSKTKSKNLLMYIRKRIDEAEDLYEILVSISFFLFSCLSIIIYIFRSVKKNLVYATKFPLISSLIIYPKSWFLKTWSNVPLRSINWIPASFFSFLNSYTLYTKINIILIINLSF